MSTPRQQNDFPQADHARPAMLITIDTEGDDLWSNPQTITTRNAYYLPRFQSLCERYGFRPTWLTNWEMVECAVYREFALDVLARDTAEVGMHLHAWNSPPSTEFDHAHGACQPCLIEYPEADMRIKIARLTDRLEEVFNTKMISHRAGRWGFNETYAKLLIEHGYRVDCSVTPGLQWRFQYVDKQNDRGIDYRDFPSHAYWIDVDQISRPGNSSLLEVPMTIVPGQQNKLTEAMHTVCQPVPLFQRVANKVAPRHHWFRPFRGNRRSLAALAENGPQPNCDYLEMALHSSELMPGGSPSFPTQRSIEVLYERLEELFAFASNHYTGRTLAEYHAMQREPSASSGNCQFVSYVIGSSETAASDQSQKVTT
ncbi:polysaccharide deacetylase family protein [Bremerella sp. T1]|uniref:hypothetical protein n=1 Tax=Bremerella sp. TYQ1 TaxID=3119568 RepID=UPI001CCF9CD7|nr:hypothetical protein [Bremerella volcania]UBM35410.1 hypothetical protein LA756_22370 [Bremerella volcania]